MTVSKICEKFAIAVSTLYAWVNQLRQHKDLLLGALPSSQTTEASFMCRLLKSDDLSQTLQRFFISFNFSFLQSTPTTPQYRPP
jgi:transposase-like protein